MLNHPDPRRTAAAQRAAQHYDWSRVGGQILAVYRAALEAAEPASAPRRRIMIIWSIISVLVIILLIIGWRLSWLATRVDRANARTESTWAALDAALVRRAQRAAELSAAPGHRPGQRPAGLRRRRRGPGTRSQPS